MTAALTQETQHEVLFPVGLPDEGMFDWLDMFLAKNPTYTELSDRVILDWAHKSGLWRLSLAMSSISVNTVKKLGGVVFSVCLSEGCLVITGRRAMV